MIDIENLIVDKVNKAVQPLLTKYPNLKVVSEYVETSAKFPLICVVEEDNYTHRETQTADLQEHQVNVAYAVYIYTTGKNKKSAAKAIAQVVDEEMQNNLFTRTVFSQISNIDRTIYRMVMRYTAVVAAPVIEGNDITYQMYRR